MDMIEGHTESELRKGIKGVIQKYLVDHDTIGATVVAKESYRRLGFDQTAPRLVRDATTRKLKILAGAVLKEMFEPDQDAETTQRHADALRRYVKSKWPEGNPEP